jgi:hypothetical protein
MPIAGSIIVGTSGTIISKMLFSRLSSPTSRNAVCRLVIDILQTSLLKLLIRNNWGIHT